MARHEAPEAAEGVDQGVDECPGAAREAARRPDARQPAHEQAQIQTADLHEEALEDVGVTPQMHAAQSPGLVEMSVGAFGALPEQAQPTGTAYPAPVGIYGGAFGHAAGRACGVSAAPGDRG